MQRKSRGLPMPSLGLLRLILSFVSHGRSSAPKLSSSQPGMLRSTKADKRLNGQSCASLANIAILPGLRPAGSHTAITILELTQDADGKGSLDVIERCLERPGCVFWSSDPPADRAKWYCKTNKLKVICSKRNRQGLW